MLSSGFGGGSTEGMVRLFAGSGKVWRVLVECLESVGRLPGGCGEDVWNAWGVCLEGVSRLSGGCGEAVWRVWG